MKGLLILLGAVTASLVTSAHASNSNDSANSNATLNECPPQTERKIFDIEGQTERLPTDWAGTPFFFKFPVGTETANIEEQKRQLRIVEEISTLVRTLTDKDFKAAAGSNKLCVKYVQKYKRSTIKVTAIDSAKKEIATRTLVAGPAEHLYLSADMPISDIKQLKYDSTTNSVIEKEQPASFYLGINWRIGDVFEEHSGNEFYKNFSLKLLLKASSRPSESFGLGIGYSFDFVDVFAARIRTKADESVGGASLDHSDATVFGVSFNISKGLGWLKK